MLGVRSLYTSVPLLLARVLRSHDFVLHRELVDVPGGLPSLVAPLPPVETPPPERGRVAEARVAMGRPRRSAHPSRSPGYRECSDRTVTRRRAVDDVPEHGPAKRKNGMITWPAMVNNGMRVDLLAGASELHPPDRMIRAATHRGCWRRGRGASPASVALPARAQPRRTRPPTTAVTAPRAAAHDRAAAAAWPPRAAAPPQPAPVPTGPTRRRSRSGGPPKDAKRKRRPRHRRRAASGTHCAS